MADNSKDAHRHFANRTCPYFPCHRTDEPDSFNCLFCYCPLYMLGADCGGSFCYTVQGVKDCNACLLPHSPGGYAHITASFPKILAAMRGGEGQTAKE